MQLTAQASNRARRKARLRQRRYEARRLLSGQPRTQVVDRAITRALRSVRSDLWNRLDEVVIADYLADVEARALGYLTAWGYEPVASLQGLRTRMVGFE